MTPEEIEATRQKLATFANVDADQVTLDTPVAPAKSEPRSLTEEGRERSGSIALPWRPVGASTNLVSDQWANSRGSVTKRQMRSAGARMVSVGQTSITASV